MLKCAITSGEGWKAMGHVGRWAHEGVDYVQLREKKMDAGELVKLAREMLQVLRGHGKTKLLVNGRPDVAIAAGADGVHLSAAEGELRPEQVREVFRLAGVGGGVGVRGGVGVVEPVIGVSCHTLEEVGRAVSDGVDLILFGPVFEKRVAGEMVGEGVGLDRLQEACTAAQGTRVLALGGVTWPRAELCIEAGAAGVAGIRLFG